jgi:hypothetical protein
MSGFIFRLETANGEIAEPSTLTAAIPDWPIGSMICLGKRTLRVIGERDDDADRPPVLIVEEA